jgi:hypothetical protein
MKDRVNPTHEEITQWARTPGAMYPMEDWDLIIATDQNADVFVSLASDPECANRGAVLNFLYVYAAQLIREGRRPESVSTLRAAIRRGSTAGLDDVRLWASRAADALDGAGADDYDFWFLSGWRKR